MSKPLYYLIHYSTMLTIVIPQLRTTKRAAKAGARLNYTAGAVVLGLIQAFGITMLARNYNVLATGSTFDMVLIVVTLVAGTTLLMWMGEKISEQGIGNGISLIIFVGIVASMPFELVQAIQGVIQGVISPLSLIVFLLLAVLVVAGVVMIQQGQRRIPVQYAKRVVGRRMYGGQSTHIPLSVNQQGDPVISPRRCQLFR